MYNGVRNNYTIIHFNVLEYDQNSALATYRYLVLSFQVNLLTLLNISSAFSRSHDTLKINPKRHKERKTSRLRFWRTEDWFESFRCWESWTLWKNCCGRPCAPESVFGAQTGLFLCETARDTSV